MGLTVTAKEEPKEIPEIGVYPVTCIGIIDRGTQKPRNPKHKSSRRLNIMVELIGTEMTEGDYAGEPFIKSRNFAASLGKKSHLRKLIEDWTGQKIGKDDEFDFEDLLGKSGNALITHRDGEGEYEGEKFANIETITPLKKRDGKVEKLDKPKTPRVSFFLPFDSEGNYTNEPFDQEAFDELPEWEQDIIKQSDEYKQLKDDGLVESKKAKGGKPKAKEEDEEEETPKRGKATKKVVEEETTTFKRRGR